MTIVDIWSSYGRVVLHSHEKILANIFRLDRATDFYIHNLSTKQQSNGIKNRNASNFLRSNDDINIFVLFKILSLKRHVAMKKTFQKLKINLMLNHVTSIAKYEEQSFFRRHLGLGNVSNEMDDVSKSKRADPRRSAVPIRKKTQNRPFRINIFYGIS